MKQRQEVAFAFICSKHICCLMTYVYSHGHILVHALCCLETMRVSFETCPMPVRKCDLRVQVPHIPEASVCFAVADPQHKHSDLYMPVSFGSFCICVEFLSAPPNYV